MPSRLKLSGTVLRETCKVSFQSGKAYQVNSIGEWYTSPLTNIPETTVFFSDKNLRSTSSQVLLGFFSAIRT